MNKLKPFLYGVILVGFSPALYAAAVTFTVDPTQNNSPISPYIYGSNSAITNVANTYYRCGGNRLSAYNWETNWSNAGSDYYYENDTLMGSLSWGPGGTAVTFLNQNKARGADSLWTLELAGYVSANGETPVQVPTADFMAAPGQTDPHGNFFPVTFVKGSPFADPPNTADGVVYMDESVNYFVNHLGKAGSGGIRFYDLDNEPGAWSAVHQEIHNYPVSYIEVATKGITVATQTTALDSGAQILGPVADGWSDMINLAGAPDAGNYSAYNTNNTWVPFLNYYLAMFQQASATAGRRLLHYLDCHVYSEGTDAAGSRINDADVSQDAATTRMQLPREMWDPTFTENNWISCCVPHYGPLTLIPRLQAAVSQYYPGTNLAFTEYDYGGGGDISGGIAQADFLGTLTKVPGTLASIWDVGAGQQYLTCAFNFYLDYDGSGSKFGDTSILASSNNVPEATVYAAKDSSHPDRLNVIILNKDYTNNNTASVTLSNLGTGQQIASIRAFRFDSAISVITASTAPSFTANTFTDTLPFRSASLYELTLSQGFFTSTPSATPTLTATTTGTQPTLTRTPTVTLTPSITLTPIATLTPTFTATQCVQLLNGCESLTENGSWSGSNSNLSLSTTDATQLTHSLQAAVTNNPAGGWNDQVFNLSGFTPTNWSNVSQLMVDINVPAGLIGSSYSQFYLFADSAPTTYEQELATNGVNVVAGQNNNLTFNISLTGAFNPSSPITKLYFIYNNNAPTGAGTYGSFYVDNIRLVAACGTAPTPTSTPSRTATPTPSMTGTPTMTVSTTPTSTRSQTPTFSPTVSATWTGTATLTPPANTATATPFNSPTPTRTMTLTATSTFTPTVPFTWTATGTYTMTPTATLSPTPTITLTPSPSTTRTPSVTLSPTATSTPTLSPSVTQTPPLSYTPTQSPTISLTPTPTSTGTLTRTPTATNTGTPTFTLTQTPTGTYSATASPTITPSPTPTSTWTTTPTKSPTGTMTPTDTLSPSASFTVTLTPTSTISWTATSTGTQTESPTGTPPPTLTLSPTSTGTATPTLTPTHTWSPTFTATPTGTNSYTSTATPTNTPTQTNSPVPATLTPSATLVFTGTYTLTATITPTVTLSPAFTGTATRTATPVLLPQSQPVLYPNPALGNTVNLSIPYGGNVQVVVYTLAFRKVIHMNLSQQVPGGVVVLSLTDDWGKPISDGLYYVVVTGQGKRWLGKLLVLR